MSPAIQFSGLASGLDTASIINAIMAAEQVAITRLQARRIQVQSRQTAVNDVKTRLANLQLKANDLTLSTKLNAKKATPGDTGVLGASTGTNAATGVFSVNVKQLATSTVATSKTPIGSAVGTATALTSAGFASTPTNGTFTINGKTFTITDVATATLEGIRDAINTGTDQPGITAVPGAGVTASIENDSLGRPNILRLTASAGNSIVVGTGADTSNVLSLVKLLGTAPSTAQNTGAANSLLVGATTAGSDAVVSAIDVASANRSDTYTFSTTDASAGQLTLTRSSDGKAQTITVPSVANGASQTLSFSDLGIKVTMTGLTASGETASDIVSKLTNAANNLIVTTQSVQSQGNLGTVLSGEPLTAGRLGTALTATSGSFKINGTTITWADSDSLNGVISRINASAAKVTASYNTLADGLVITAKSTGSPLISIEDVAGGGNLMAAMKVATGGPPATTDATTQVAGQNAVISIDGGADFSSANNTVSGAVTGVTLDLKKAGTTQVTVAQDADTAVDAVKGLIDQANSALDFIREKTKYDSVAKKGEILLGDSTIRSIETRLVGLLSGPFSGATSSDKYGSLGNLGISFGAVGSGVGTTKNLVLDETKFRNAMVEEPAAVEKVFNTFSNTATFTDGTGSITSITGAPAGQHKSGQYLVTDSLGDGSLSATFTPSGGGVAQELPPGTITAGGTNNILIYGITLSSTALSAGTDTIDVTVNTLGVAHLLNDYLKDTLGITGAFQARQDSTNSQVKSIDDQISSVERRLEVRRAALERKFAELERVLGQLKSQQETLSQQLAQLSAK